MTRLSKLILVLIAAGLLAIATARWGVTAANVLPETGADLDSIPVTANQLKPDECSALNLNNVVTGSGTFSGTAGNDLIIGSNGADTINGGTGDDCILGGGGNDILNGEDNNDVILGGSGNDTIDGGNDTDVCYGGADTDTFANCETQNDP